MVKSISNQPIFRQLSDMFKFQKVKVYKSMGPDFYKRVARKQFMDRSRHQKYKDLYFN